jgi:hypothetical protein
MTEATNEAVLPSPEGVSSSGASAANEQGDQIRASEAPPPRILKSSGQTSPSPANPATWTSWGETYTVGSPEDVTWHASNPAVRIPPVPTFEVVAGFPTSTEKALRQIGPELFRRVAGMPELKGVRLSLRIYRFVSSDERDLDLVRVELRIPGIGLKERFPIWRTFRAELNDCLRGAGADGTIGASHLATATFRESVSTVVVG